MVWAVGAAAICAHVDAGKMSLQWGKSNDANVTGYKVRVAHATSGATTFIDVGNTNTVNVESLMDGQTYKVAVFAYTRDGIDSDPSNLISYTVPVPTTTTYALQFGKFSHGIAEYSPHGTMSASGEAYPAGTQVALFASPGNGFVCTGWMINSVFSPGNPTDVVMDQNKLVTPIFTRENGTPAPADPALAAMEISTVGQNAVISIGGELGAWVLEGTSNFSSWSQVAIGLTSDEVTVQTANRFSFYRVRSAELTTF